MASNAKVPPTDEHSDGDFSPANISAGDKEHRYDVIETAELQTYWNKFAALSACLAAACQAVSLMLPGA